VTRPLAVNHAMQMGGGVFVKVCNCPHAAVGASEQAIRGAGACAEWTSAEVGVVVGNV
jgi:hypothetical protein